MNTSLSRDAGYKPVSLHLAYENVHALLAEIHLYVFNCDGVLLDSQAVRRDKVLVAVDEEALRDAKIVLAPPLENPADGLLTLEFARSQPIFETTLRYDSAQARYQLPPVPESIWRWWLVHSLWKNIHGLSKKKTGLIIW